MSGRRASYTSPRLDVAALVPEDARRILELGCSTGATAGHLKARQGAEVVGVERDPAFAEAATAVVDQLLVRDLNEPDWMDGVDGGFNCIVAADVLEHLVDPWSVLAAAVKRLAPGGRVVLSLPNIRHVQSLVALSFGRWPYRDRGVHDATHLRFFTLRGIRGMLAAAGLEIESLVRSYRFLDTESPLDRLASLARVTPLRELFTYQYLLRARPAEENTSPSPESVPPWVRAG